MAPGAAVPHPLTLLSNGRVQPQGCAGELAKSAQFSQNPQEMLNGSTTQSPTLTFSTPEPTSTTSRMFSCPKVRPGSKSVRPSYLCRSDPQMLVLVMRTSASVGRSIFASGTSLTRTSRGPWYTTAFMDTSFRTFFRRS